MPLSQNDEQHWALLVHALPSVSHVVLSGVHLPLPQVPLQHCPLDEHVWLSLVQGGGWQEPPRQSPLQQSELPLHLKPRFTQLPSPFQLPSLPVGPSYGTSLPSVPSLEPSLPFPLSPPHEGAAMPSAKMNGAAPRRRNLFFMRPL